MLLKRVEAITEVEEEEENTRMNDERGTKASLVLCVHQTGGGALSVIDVGTATDKRKTH